MKTNYVIIISLMFFLILAPQDLRGAEYSFDLTYQKKCQKILGSTKGSIILLEVKSKKILAVTNPRIAFYKFYPPGSIFKIIAAFSFLEESLVLPYQVFECRNFFKINNHSFTCCVPSGHRKVDLVKALAYSCSVYFYTNGQRLEPSKLRHYAKLFSLSRVNLPNNRVEYTNMLVGEGGLILVTPWQMAVLTEHLIKEDIPHKKETFRLIKEATRQAVEIGIARKSALENISIAGKTGTATSCRAANLKDSKKNHGWFIGFAPYEKPEIIVVVFLESGRGYDEAATIAKRVFKMYFHIN